MEEGGRPCAEHLWFTRCFRSLISDSGNRESGGGMGCDRPKATLLGRAEGRFHLKLLS